MKPLLQRSATRAGSVLLALFLSACGPGTPDEDPAISPPSLEEPPGAGDNDGEASGQGVPETLEGTASTANAADTWSATIKERLTELSDAFLSSNEAGADALAALMDGDELTIHGLTEIEGTTLYGDATQRITEYPSSERSSSRTSMEPKAVHAALRRTLSLEDADTQAKAKLKFKLIGIHEVDGSLSTSQRLTAHGSHEGRPVQSLGTVEISWKIAANAEPPVLTGLSITNLVQHVFVTDKPTGFVDITGQVLGQSSAWETQLQVGMNTWARRIDRALKPDFFGYHGLAVRDVDGDGLEDVYLCQPGGLPNLLFLQQDDGTLVDVSAKASVDWLDNTTGALLVDLDNDGDADLAIASRNGFLIMENDGQARFSLRAKLTGIGRGYSPTAADVDLDGDLDLLVLRYTGTSAKEGAFPTPHPFHDARNGGANVLLENEGDFVFREATETAGLEVDNFRFSFAASWEDFDNDGDPDLYIANDFGPNQLFRNDAGRFTDVSETSQSQDWGFGMGVTWGDYNRDGRMDLYVSSMFSSAGNQVVPQTDFNPNLPETTRRKFLKMVRGNTLLRNEGTGAFADVSDPMAVGLAGWAWGAAFADLNNDGWEDLYVANGYISQPDTEDL